MRRVRSHGPDGCWFLDDVDEQLTARSLEIRFRGEHDGGGDCTQAPVTRVVQVQ